MAHFKGPEQCLEFKPCENFFFPTVVETGKWFEEADFLLPVTQYIGVAGERWCSFPSEGATFASAAASCGDHRRPRQRDMRKGLFSDRYSCVVGISELVCTRTFSP